MTSFPETNCDLKAISEERAQAEALKVPSIQNINNNHNNINSLNNNNTFSLSKDEAFHQPNLTDSSNLHLNKTDRSYCNLNKTTPHNISYQHNLLVEKKAFPFFPISQPSHRSSTPIIETFHDKHFQPSANQFDHKFNYHISSTEPNCSNVNVDNNITNDIFITDPNDIKMMNDWTPLHTEPSLMFEKYKEHKKGCSKYKDESGVVQRTGSILDNIDRVIHSRRNNSHNNNIPEEKDIVYPPVYCSRKDNSYKCEGMSHTKCNYAYNSIYGNKANMDNNVFSTFGVNTISSEGNNKEVDIKDNNHNDMDDIKHNNSINNHNSKLKGYGGDKVKERNGVNRNMKLFFDYSSTNDKNELDKICNYNKGKIALCSEKSPEQMHKSHWEEKYQKSVLNYRNKLSNSDYNDDEFYVIPKDKRIKMTPEMIIKDEMMKQQHKQHIQNLYNETFKRVCYASQKYTKYSDIKND